MISPSVRQASPTSVPTLTPLATPGTLTCSVVETVAEFLALGPLWDELADRATNRSPALAWPWLRAWWDVFGEKCPKTGRVGGPYVVLVYDELTPVAAYPFIEHARSMWSPGLRRLRPMGHSGETEPSGLTEEVFCVVATGFEERARAFVIDHLAERVSTGRWDCAIVRQINHEEPPRATPARRGVFLNSKTKRGPQIVRLPESWSEFRRRLSKSMRDNLGYYPRMIGRAGHTYAIRISETPAEIEQAATALVRLHRDRVFSEVGQTHQDYFADPWQERMLEHGIGRLADVGLGFIATLEIDGRPAAAQSFIESDSELLVHYSGFAPGHAKFSPLLVLQTEVFRRAIELKGIRKLNLLFGASPWQKRWGSESEGQEIRTLVLRKSLGTAVRAALYAIRRESVAYCRRSGLRRWWRRFGYRSAQKR